MYAMAEDVCLCIYTLKVDSQNGFLEIEAGLVRKRKILTVKELDKYICW